MNQTTSIRLSKVEKESISRAMETLGMSMPEYFVKLHYAFWELARNILKEKQTDDLSKEQALIKKLREMGVIENENIRIK